MAKRPPPVNALFTGIACLSAAVVLGQTQAGRADDRESAAADKPLAVELKVADSLTTGTVATFSVVITNLTDEPRTARCSVRLRGLAVRHVSCGDKAGSRTGVGALELAPRGQAVVHWKVTPQQPGRARVRATVRSAGFSTTLEKSCPVSPQPHE